MKRKVIIISAVVLAAALAALLLFVIIPEGSYDAVRHMNIADVDPNTIGDGIYHGEYAYGHYTYQADVTVKAHRIVDISIQSGREDEHEKDAEGVIKKILAEQKTNVDVVSGATTTSKAILKAVENALQSAK